MSTWFLLIIGYVVISLQKSRCYLYFLLELSVSVGLLYQLFLPSHVLLLLYV